MATKRKAEDQEPDDRRVCTKCENPKDLEDFGRDSSKPSGRDSHCRHCKRARREAIASDNKAKLAADPTALGTTCKCSRCQKTLPRDEFNNNFSTKNGKQSYCITCAAATDLLEYLEADKLREDWFREHGGCIEPGCKEKNPKYLHGAHLDRETKEDTPSHIRAPHTLKIEHDKCKPLCIEHHARRTSEESGETRVARRMICHRLVRAEKQRLGKCTRCPRTYDPTNPRFWHFDHLDSKTKIDDVSNMVADCRPLEMITAEMKKCQLLCGNCHVDVTAERLQDHWRIWLQSLGKGTLKECLPALATRWDLDECDIEEIIIAKNYRREVFESAHGSKWVEYIPWDKA
jgi:hypothetical protein